MAEAERSRLMRAFRSCTRWFRDRDHLAIRLWWEGHSAQQIAEFVGLPEAQLPLAQAAVYVACAPKSNACSAGMYKALQAVENEPIKAVPLHLKDSHSTGARQTGDAARYRYPHDDPRGFVVQEYLPGSRETYYSPTDRGREKNIRLYLQSLQSMIQDQGRADDHAGA